MIPTTPRLQDKKVLVTGSSRGIGAGIARLLASQGAQLGVAYSSQREAAEQVLKSLPGEGHMILELRIDDEASVETAFETFIGKMGRIDGLVNNAGITRDTLLLRMKVADFDAVINTNLRGTFLCTRAASKLMLKARSGSIVNITSIIGEMGNAGQANYAASKAGIEGLSKSVAQELASRGIRVNCVAPGFIATEMTDVLSEQHKKAILEKVPLGVLGEVEDVATAVAFLLSSEARYITGQTISVNGGMYM